MRGVLVIDENKRKKYIENFDIMYSKSMLSQKLVILHNLLKLQFR